jgi:flagellar M-ring protein FliF
MLTITDGRTLSDEQVRAITHLVSSSVPGLAPDQVSVVDQDGRLVSGEAVLGGAADQQLRVQTAVEDRYRRALTAMLTPIVGARNFTAEVSADLDFDEKQATRESLPANDARVVRETGRWSADRNAPPAYGIPGALANSPPPAASLTTTPPGTDAVAGTAVNATDGQRSSEEFQRSFELGRETSVTKSATGTVRRLTVAVALANPKGAKPRSRAEIAAIEQLVKNAVGFDAARGDQITVSARTFAAENAGADAGWWQADWIEPLVRNLTALLVALLLVVGGMIAARRWRKAQAAQAADRALAALAIRDADTGSGAGSDPAITLDMIAAAPSYAARGELVRRFVRQDPERAALVVRQLLGSEKKEAAA